MSVKSKFQKDKEALEKAGALRLITPGGTFTGTYGKRNQVPGTPAPTSPVHRGIDVANRRGAALLSLIDGYVSRDRTMNDGAKEIIVSAIEGDWRNGWRYVHNDAHYALYGYRVHRGQAIAAVGATGNVNGAHVHLERLADGVAVDPVPYLLELAGRLDNPKQKVDTPAMHGFIFDNEQRQITWPNLVNNTYTADVYDAVKNYVLSYDHVAHKPNPNWAWARETFVRECWTAIAHANGHKG